MQQMYQKKKSLSNSLKKNRNIFYIPLLLLFASFNLLSDLEDESLMDAVLEQLLLCPLIYLLFMGFSLLRDYFFNKVLNKKVISHAKIKPLILWIVLLLPIAIILSLFMRFISLYFFNDDADDKIFDTLFFAINIAFLASGIFIFVFENYLELIYTEKEYKLTILEMKNEKTLAQYQVLKNQINPHFLFNSFNTLIGLVYISPLRAEQFIHQLSDFYRYNLEEGDELVVTLEKELKLIHAYIQLNNIRFENSIDFRLEINPLFFKKLLPPMTLIILIENALKHNHFDIQNPIIIDVKIKDNSLFVSNTFCPKYGSVKNVSLGIGLKNLINQYLILETEVLKFVIENGCYIAKISLIEPSL
jgi:two-component system, LytTR family, sensor kinase